MNQHDEALHIAGSNNVQHGQIPSDDDLYWVGAMRQVLVDSLSAMHVGALAVFTAALAGWIIIMLALIFSDPARDLPSLVVGVVPMLAWSLSALWSLRVLSVRRYRYFANSPDSARQAIVRIARRKKRHLTGAIVFWCAGIVAFLVTLAYQL
ncbi:MAG: hypothetical protein Kow0074_23580 [Candidatus Zixiibacteriota bacterium]